MDRRERDLRRLAKKHGFSVDGRFSGTNHYRLTCDVNGREMTAALSPSDYRNEKNLIATMKRLSRLPREGAYRVT